MGGVDLVSRVLIPYSSQRRGIKWYRKPAELHIDITVFNSFILYEKLNPFSNFDHLMFRNLLIEEIIMCHMYGGASYTTGPSSEPERENLIRLTERHFTSQVPSTANKARA